MFGDGVFRALLATYRRGMREGRHHLDCDLVLAESVKLANARSVGVPDEVRVRLAQAIQRVDVPDRKAYTGPDLAVVPEPIIEVEALLREVVWRATNYSGRRLRERYRAGDGAPPMWSDSVGIALGTCLTEARSAGVAYVSGTHLLLGLLVDHTGRAATLARDAGIDPDELAEELRRSSGWTEPGPPRAPLMSLLDMEGVLDTPMPWILRPLSRYLRLTVRRSGYTVVLHSLGDEIVRHSVRQGSATVTTFHVVAAMLSLQWQLTATGQSLKVESSPYDAIGPVLDAFGFQLSAAEACQESAEVESEHVSRAEASKRFWITTGPPWSRRTASAYDRARNIADDLGRFAWRGPPSARRVVRLGQCGLHARTGIGSTAGRCSGSALWSAGSWRVAGRVWASALICASQRGHDRRPPGRLHPPPARAQGPSTTHRTQAKRSASVVSTAEPGVDRTFLYRHRDLLEQLHAAEAQPATAAAGPTVSRASLQTDPLNAQQRTTRLAASIQQLESACPKHSASKPGASPGLGTPDDVEQLKQHIITLEQQAADLRLQLDERDQELQAARAANRELMTQLNAPRHER
jgi:hypothetical protein